MIKNVLLTLVFLIITKVAAFSQDAHFVETGVITFEKRINLYAIAQKQITKENDFLGKTAFEAFKAANSQFRVLQSRLNFAYNKTLFIPDQTGDLISMKFGSSPLGGQINTVYTDLVGHKRLTQKKVFDFTYLIADTLQKVKWKITDETREIAGYTCRRANGLILDSVYVVAFYTVDIPISGGPESFYGLPGMILGAALPHENATWYATKVVSQVETKKIVPPAEGFIIDFNRFKETIKAQSSNWGMWAKNFVFEFLL
jgi:GLPGLI family protein